MYKNVQANPEKSQKLTQHSCSSMLTLENFWKQAMDIVSSAKVARSLPKSSSLLWEALVVWSLCSNLPQMGQNFYHGMLMPLHDSMPSFMNFRRVLDLLEFNNQASQCFAGYQRCPGVWNSFPFLAWDLSMQPRTNIWFCNPFLWTEHVHVVQIWIMHIKCLENPVNV